MTSLICIENATQFDFMLIDQDGQNYGIIKSNGYYYLKLRRNKTGDRQYTFSQQDPFYMWINTFGEISRITPNNTVHLEVKYSYQDPPNDIDPVCIRRKTNIRHDKLLITPIDNIFARANVPVIQYLFDLSYGS